MIGVLENIKQSKAVLQSVSHARHPPAVLVIEDDADDRDWLKAKLQEIGCDVVAVKNGKEALAAAESKPFRLFLVNLGLPDITGDKLIQMLKEKYPRVPSAVVTGYDNEQTRAKVFDCGAVMLFPKPWTRTDCMQLLSLFNLTNALMYGDDSAPTVEGT